MTMRMALNGLNSIRMGLGVISINRLLIIDTGFPASDRARARVVIGLAAGQDMIGQLVGAVLPWFPLLLPNRIPEIALMVATGQTPPTYIPLVSGLLLSAVFVVVAIWRFKKTEF